MSHFFAPFMSLLMSLGLINMPAQEAQFPSIEWFAIQLQEVGSTDAAVAAAAAPANAPITPVVPVAKEVVPAVMIKTKPPAPMATQPETTTSSSEGPAAAVATTQLPPASLSTLEQSVLAALNAARATSGLSPLSADARLSAIARAHSEDMLANAYFSHDDLSGCSASCRYEKAGYAFWSMGENIFWMEGYDLSTAASAAKVVDGWQNSPGHRANDLGDYTKVGIGVAQQGSKIYVTADFATPQ